MTTSRSPLHKIKAQADRIAKGLKDLERGELPPIGDPTGKLAAAKQRDSIKFGVVMDDKVITIEMPWATIRATSEAAISEYIVNYMRANSRANISGTP